MDLTPFNLLTQTDMNRVNQLIQQQLSSNVALVNQLSFYIINSGGKRIRPLMSLLAAKAVGYDEDHHIKLAAIIEFIHTATLLHDDVVDASDVRRGQQSANKVFGEPASVLVGDFLYTRAFQMMVQLESMPVMAVMANATNTIAEGEVLQLMRCNDPKTSEENYFEVIYCKTARLFEAACEVAALLAQTSDTVYQGLKQYGQQLGNAFQLIDDILDYSANQQALGKSIGDDLVEGKPTLPLIYALTQATVSEQQLLTTLIEQGGNREQLPEVLTIINRTKALDYCYHQAESAVKKAIQGLQPLADSEYKTALITIAEQSIQRQF